MPPPPAKPEASLMDQLMEGIIGRRRRHGDRAPGATPCPGRAAAGREPHSDGAASAAAAALASAPGGGDGGSATAATPAADGGDAGNTAGAAGAADVADAAAPPPRPGSSGGMAQRASLLR